MKRFIRTATTTVDSNIAAFSDELATQYPYKIFYESEQGWGDDFQKIAEQLGCIKVEGKYQGKYQPIIFYLCPSEDVFDKLRSKQIPGIHMNSISEYLGSDDYIITNVFTPGDVQNKFRKLGSESDEGHFTLKDITNALKSLREQGYKVTIKNGSVQLTSYEGDMYYFARLSDLLDYINRLPDPYLEDDIWDAVTEVSEWAGYHHAADIPFMKEKIARLREKYFNS